MFIGTCNFNNMYNGSFVSKSNAFKLLDYFFEHGGEGIDCAYNYNFAKPVIEEWLNKNNYPVKIIMKIWNKDEIEKCFESLGLNKIFCIFNRNYKSDNNLLALQEYKKNGLINEYGASVYFEHELLQQYNNYHLPMSIPESNLDTLFMFSNVYLRSIFNYSYPKDIDKSLKIYYSWKEHERIDLNHRIYPVMGVSTIEQIKFNLENFK